jgi:hypothetical protein
VTSTNAFDGVTFGSDWAQRSPLGAPGTRDMGVTSGRPGSGMVVP